MGHAGGRRAVIRRGEVYWVNLDPTVGAEIRKRRPALVVSNDINNLNSPTITVAPLTSAGTDRIYPFQVKLPPGACDQREATKVKAEQIRTVDKSRLAGQSLGSLSDDLMLKVDAALRLHLALEQIPGA